MAIELPGSPPPPQPLMEMHVRVLPSPEGPRIEVAAPFDDPIGLLAMIGQLCQAAVMHWQKKAAQQQGSPLGQEQQIRMLARMRDCFGKPPGGQR